jgi:hypothetical protein
MNQPLILELEPVAAQQQAPRTDLALPQSSPAGMMLAALRDGASLEQVEKMMDLQERWEKREAEKAFNEAMAAFKGEAVEIIKRKQVDFANKSGGRTQYKHAELSDVIDAAAPALSKHGFSWRWNTEQGSGFLKVTCILKHNKGHSESCTLSGPYDESGGKNAIQAIVSTKTYLERHTLKAICGLAEKGEDDDGKAAGRSLLDTWIDLANAAATLPDLDKVSKDGARAFTKAKDVEGYRAFASEVRRRSAELRKEAGRA